MRWTFFLGVDLLTLNQLGGHGGQHVGEGRPGQVGEDLAQRTTGHGGNDTSFESLQDEAVACGVIQQVLLEEGSHKLTSKDAFAFGIDSEPFQGILGSAATLYHTLGEVSGGVLQESFELLS